MVSKRRAAKVVIAFLCFIGVAKACFATQSTEEDCTFGTLLENPWAFGAGQNPCSADDCRTNACNCTLSDGDSRTVLSQQCPDPNSIVIVSSDGTTVVRSTAVTGFTLVCQSGSLTARGFTDGLGDIDMVVFIQCNVSGSDCPDTVNSVLPGSPGLYFPLDYLFAGMCGDPTLAFGPNAVNCAQQPMGTAGCVCSLFNNQDVLIFTNPCSVTNTFAVFTGAGCELRTIESQNTRLRCQSGVVSMTGFIDGHGDVGGVTAVGCSCMNPV